MRCRVAVFASVACAAAVAVSVALGGGGRTMASAPMIPFGQEQLNTLNGIDFWRVPLREGDRLTLIFGPQQQGRWVEVCLLTPDVSDTTAGNQPCYARLADVSDNKTTLDARPGGNWTLAVLPYPGCESGGILN